jgi:glycosyltransferase involved in cell wall biosynthesis
MAEKPTVSIGMPVYNGERFLEQALESMISQTFYDIEIIISDNCSTDRTAEICNFFKRKDNRIKYYRQLGNLGAARNYNFVFEKSCGKYFKWAAHDDFMDENALDMCVNLLEADSEAVLAHPLLVDVDIGGKTIREFDRGLLGSSSTDKRFWSLIEGSHNCAEIFGVIRTEALRRTKLIRDYTDSDRTLLGELALLGKICQVSKTHFYRRRHQGQSTEVFKNFHSRAEWFNPENRTHTIPSNWLQLIDWFRFVVRAPLTGLEKCKCLFLVGKRLKWYRRRYIYELRFATRHSLFLIKKPQ